MKKIKLFDPVIGISEEREMIKILRSGFWASGSGTGLVKQFETQFQKYVNSKSCIAVNSGTAANELTMLALKHIFPEGGEIILPPLAWVSDINSILFAGFNPTFVDINLNNL